MANVQYQGYRPSAPQPETIIKTTTVSGAEVQHVALDDSAGMPLVVTGANTGVRGLRVYGGPTDPISDIPVVMDFPHHQIHEGETHQAMDQQLSLGTSTVKYGFLTNTNTDTTRLPHLLFECDVYNGTARIDIYEGATVTGGTTIMAYNRKRSSIVTAGSTAKTGVTSTTGTLIDSFFAAAGVRVGGSGRTDAEWDLASNTQYRIDVVGLTAGTKAIIKMKWYEDLGV